MSLSTSWVARNLSSSPSVSCRAPPVLSFVPPPLFIVLQLAQLCQLVCGLHELVRETHLHLPEIQDYIIFVVELLLQLLHLQVNLEQNVLLFVEVYLEHLIVLLENSFWFSASSLAAVSFFS